MVSNMTYTTYLLNECAEDVADTPYNNIAYTLPRSMINSAFWSSFPAHHPKCFILFIRASDGRYCERCEDAVTSRSGIFPLCSPSGRVHAEIRKT